MSNNKNPMQMAFSLPPMVKSPEVTLPEVRSPEAKQPGSRELPLAGPPQLPFTAPPQLPFTTPPQLPFAVGPDAIDWSGPQVKVAPVGLGSGQPGASWLAMLNRLLLGR
jgi:hypothetical protein